MSFAWQVDHGGTLTVSENEAKMLKGSSNDCLHVIDWMYKNCCPLFPLPSRLPRFGFSACSKSDFLSKTCLPRMKDQIATPDLTTSICLSTTLEVANVDTDRVGKSSEHP